MTNPVTAEEARRALYFYMEEAVRKRRYGCVISRVGVCDIARRIGRCDAIGRISKRDTETIRQVFEQEIARGNIRSPAWPSAAVDLYAEVTMTDVDRYAGVVDAFFQEMSYEDHMLEGAAVVQLALEELRIPDSPENRRRLAVYARRHYA